MDCGKLNGGRIPFRALSRIRFNVLVQVAFFGEPLGAGKGSGSDKDEATCTSFTHHPTRLH